MRLRPVILLLVATAAACGGGSLKGGTAGTSATGTGGTAGTTGVGGTFVVGDAGAGWQGTAGDGAPIAGSGGAVAGSGGAIAGSGGGGSGGSGSPACGGAGGASDIVEVAIADSSGMAVTSVVTKTRVTVTTVDSCATVACPSTIPLPGTTSGPRVNAMATRFVLTAPGARTWTLYLRYTAMPADLVKVGDEFDLTVQASIDPFLYSTLNQTVVLGLGDIVLFASDQSSFGVPPLPQLDAYGVVTSDAGVTCEMGQSFGCIIRPHAVRVAMNTSAATVPAGITSRIGQLTSSPLTFTNAAFTQLADTGNCDTKGHSLMAGFKVPIGGTGGTGGTGGSGGGVGGTGGSGTGGTGVVHPACPAQGPSDSFGLAIAGPDGLAHGSADVAVSVTSVDVCGTVSCPSWIGPGTDIPVDSMATRFVLTAADARSWTLYLRYTPMPADLIKAGDTLDMKVTYTFDAQFPAVPGKTLVLSRGSDLVAFVWDAGSLMFPGLSTPQLPGVGIGDGGACGPPATSCPIQNHAVTVTVGTTSALVGFGTNRIGSLTFTNLGFNEGYTMGGCDAPWRTLMAGFKTP